MNPELWYWPDVNADLLELLDASKWPSGHAAVTRVGLYPAQLAPEPLPAAGVNHADRLEQGGFFRSLGIPLALETGACKKESPDGLRAADDMEYFVNRVRSAGGDIALVTFDEPLTGALDFAHVSPAQAAEATHHCIERAAALGIAYRGFTEAYPRNTIDAILNFATQVDAPTHLLLDVDVSAFGSHGITPAKLAADLTRFQTTCSGWGIPFGVIVNGGVANDPQAYRSMSLAWLRRIHDAMQRWPDVLSLASWKASDPATRHPNGLPVNTPEADPYSHAALLRDAVAIINGGTT